MRWPDFIVKAAASIACLIIWRYTLRFLAARIPTISGEEAYFPSHLVDDDKALNSYRLSIAEQSYQRAIKEPDHFSPLEIRIIASDRRQNYITQVIGFLLESYQSHRRLSPVLEICNVEQVVFEELQRFQLHVPIRTIGKASSRRATVKETIKKEAADYWNCLNRTTKARYVILLEDDALVVPDFARLMTLLMKQLDVNPHIDYVKMYHPNQLRKIPSIPMAVVMTVVTCCVYQLVIFRRVLAVWLLVTAIPMYATLRSYGSQSSTAKLSRVRRQCGCIRQLPLQCSCSSASNQNYCGCAPQRPCGCSLSSPSCILPCEQQCTNSCQLSSPVLLCQITCRKTCAAACRNSLQYRPFALPAPAQNTQAVVIKPVAGQGCASDCGNKCNTACTSQQYSVGQCSATCQASCSRVCNQASATAKPVQVQIKVEGRPTSKCLSICNDACQTSCSSTTSSSECRATCDLTCSGLCPSVATTVHSPIQLQPLTTTTAPLKINIQMAPEVQQQPASFTTNISQKNSSGSYLNAVLSSPTQLQQSSVQCLQQCDTGCQQSCLQRVPPPSEGCSWSCTNTCNHVCAPSQPSQMTAKDVSTFPVRLDPKQRCSAECQSVCQMACRSQSPPSHCIDTCVPQCDKACTSPLVQRISADLFAPTPAPPAASPTPASAAAPPTQPSPSTLPAVEPVLFSLSPTAEAPLKLNINWEQTETAPPTLLPVTPDCVKECESTCAEQCANNPSAQCSEVCQAQCTREICPKTQAHSR